MTEVNAKLYQLRDAGTKLRRSSREIEQAIKECYEMMQSLYGMGFESGASAEFMMKFRAEDSAMIEWPKRLDEFAGNLFYAADQLEAATRPTGEAAAAPPPPLAYDFASAPVPTQTHSQYHVGDYTSGASQPVAETLTLQQQQMQDAQNRLSQLEAQRDAKATEIAELRERVAEFGGSDAALGRIEALEGELAALEADIATQQEIIEQLEIDISGIEERLALVRPGPGADLELIARLENAETEQWIKDSTADCVNYIVNRMTIPPGIPRNAHMWDEMVLEHPEYGINIGDVPLVGSVMVMEREHEWADSIFGHVLYVERVDPDGSVWITDNLNPHTPVRLQDFTDEISGENIKYLYFPWETRP